MGAKRKEARSRSTRRAPLLVAAGALGALVSVGLLWKRAPVEPVKVPVAAAATPTPPKPRPPTPYERLPAVVARIGQKELGKEVLRPVLEGVEGGSPRQEQLAQELAWMTAKGRVQHEVLYREAKRRGVEMSPEDRESVEFLEKREQQAQPVVSKVGLDAADAIRQYRETMVIKRLLELEIYDKVQVSPDELARAYEGTPEAYWHPEAYRVRRILVAADPAKGKEHMQAALERARALHSRASEPEADFAALARAESEGPLRSEGGLVGDFNLDEAPIRDPRVLQVIRSIEPGRASHPIYTDEGFQILYVEKKTPQRRMSLEEARPLVRKALQYEKGAPDAMRWAEELERAAGVEVLIPKPPSLDAPPAMPTPGSP